MEIKLIKLSEDHYIVVDDSEIKEGDSCYDYYTKSIQQSTPNVNDGNAEEYFKKITQSTLPLYFLLEENYFTTLNLKPDWSTVKELSLTEVEDGFKAHQELVKDKFVLSEQQIKELILNGYNLCKRGGTEMERKDLEKTIIKSRLLKTEWDIEIDEQGKIKLI